MSNCGCSHTQTDTFSMPIQAFVGILTLKSRGSRALGRGKQKTLSTTLKLEKYICFLLIVLLYAYAPWRLFANHIVGVFKHYDIHNEPFILTDPKFVQRKCDSHRFS